MSILPASLNRQERRQALKGLERANARQPARMTIIPRESWPSSAGDRLRGVWRSRDFLAQLAVEPSGAMRLSVNRTRLDSLGDRWDDNISWDELMRVKRECGFGDLWAVEVMPADAHIVNVANMRHLWLMAEAPQFAWKRGATVP